MYDGRLTITTNADKSIRVASTLGGEEIDLGQGASTDFEVFNNDSSVVFFGRDSTIIIRHPLRKSPDHETDPTTSVPYSEHQTSAPNIAVSSNGLYTISIPNISPGVPCIISLRGLDGIEIERQTMTPATDQLHTSLSLEGLLTGMYALSVCQGERILRRQCLLIH
jgi:hypothetical protein